MSYATTDDVLSHFRNLDIESENAAITPEEMELFLGNAFAQINVRLSKLYNLPITEAKNPRSFAYLKTVQTYLVCCVVDDILNDYSEADKKPQWCQKAEKLLEVIAPMNKNGKQVQPVSPLPDADYKGTDAQTTGITLSATTGRQFFKGRDQW